MSALILLRRWWHIGAIAALLLALAGQQWRLDRARAAHAATEARWQQAEAEAAQLAADRTRRQQQAVDTADSHAAARIDTQTIVETRYVDRVHEIYRDRDDPLCIDADGMRLITDADRDRAATPASATGISPG